MWVKKKKTWVIFSSNLNDRYCHMFFSFWNMSYFYVQKYFSYVKYELPDMIYYPKLEIDYSCHCKYYRLLHVFHPLPTPYDQHDFSLFVFHVFKIVSWFFCGCVLFLYGWFIHFCLFWIYCMLYLFPYYIFSKHFFESVLKICKDIT